MNILSNKHFFCRIYGFLDTYTSVFGALFVFGYFTVLPYNSLFVTLTVRYLFSAALSMYALHV